MVRVESRDEGWGWYRENKMPADMRRRAEIKDGRAPGTSVLCGCQIRPALCLRRDQRAVSRRLVGGRATA